MAVKNCLSCTSDRLIGSSCIYLHQGKWCCVMLFSERHDLCSKGQCLCGPRGHGFIFCHYGFGSWLNAGNRFLHKASVTIHCPCLRGEWWTPIQEHWPAQLWSTLSALWWIRQPSFNGYFYEHICELVNNTSSQMHINKLRTHPPIFFS